MTSTSIWQKAATSPTVLAIGGLYLIGMVLTVFWPVKVDTGIRPLLEGWIRDSGLDRGGSTVVYDAIEFAANVILFAPLGALAHWFAQLMGSRLPLVIGLLVPTVAEIGQWLFLPGRVPDVRDVIAGMIGIGLGAAAHSLLARRRRPTAQPTTD